MERSKINSAWPTALRWFLVQELNSFTPWHFIKEPEEMAFAAKVFHHEDVHAGEVFVFARRQDCDDFAGLKIIDGRITDEVIYFHPVFTDTSKPSPRTWNILVGCFEDTFAFVTQVVVPDMKDWAMTEDANGFEPRQ
ncbi:MAG TPA: hypothetical protein VGH19_20940 [Verrucomicrobiae bacterium]